MELVFQPYRSIQVLGTYPPTPPLELTRNPTQPLSRGRQGRPQKPGLVHQHEKKSTVFISPRLARSEVDLVFWRTQRKVCWTVKANRKKALESPLYSRHKMRAECYYPIVPRDTRSRKRAMHEKKLLSKSYQMWNLYASSLNSTHVLLWRYVHGFVQLTFQVVDAADRKIYIIKNWCLLCFLIVVSQLSDFFFSVFFPAIRWCGPVPAFTFRSTMRVSPNTETRVTNRNNLVVSDSIRMQVLIKGFRIYVWGPLKCTLHRGVFFVCGKRPFTPFPVPGYTSIKHQFGCKASFVNTEGGEGTESSPFPPFLLPSPWFRYEAIVNHVWSRKCSIDQVRSFGLIELAWPKNGPSPESVDYCSSSGFHTHEYQTWQRNSLTTELSWQRQAHTPGLWSGGLYEVITHTQSRIWLLTTTPSGLVILSGILHCHGLYEQSSLGVVWEKISRSPPVWTAQSDRTARAPRGAKSWGSPTGCAGDSVKPVCETEPIQ